MKYKVRFKIDVVGRQNSITRKNAEADIISELSKEELEKLRHTNDFKKLCVQSVVGKVRGTIFNIEIGDILEK